MRWPKQSYSYRKISISRFNMHVTAPALGQIIPAPGDVKPNAYTVHDDEIAIRDGDQLKPLKHLPIQTRLRIRGMIQVRDAVRECLRTQLEDKDDSDVELARAQLNQRYDRFVAHFGPLSDRVNAKAFQGDPDLPLLMSLENYDAETKKATKTAVFRERTIQRQKPIESVDSAKEALIVSLNEKGRVDLPHMARLLGRPAERVSAGNDRRAVSESPNSGLGNRGSLSFRERPRKT